MTAPTPSIQTLIDTYAKDVAFAADEEPATKASEFIDQLTTAAINLDHAGINGTEDLDKAATDLTDAVRTTDETEAKVLRNRAARHLKDTADMVDEYRLML